MTRFAAALLVLACFACTEEAGVGQQHLTTKARGLWLTSNPLDAPAGSLSEATNAVVRRHGVVEPRRGQRPDATVPGGDVYVSALTSFEDALILHSSNNAFGRRVDSTTVSAYSGTFPPPTGKPTRFVEATGALYATTSTGPVRLDSPSDEWVRAGVPPGLEGKAEVTGSSGWLGGGGFATGTVTLGGGAGNVTVVVNGTSVGPVPFNTSDTQTATDTASAINASALVAIVTANAVGTVITITSNVVGASQNYSLAASRTAGTATVSGDTLTGGEDGETVGYRVGWGGRDGDGQLMVGAPSGRFLVTNTAGSGRDVLLTTPIPNGINPDVHFLLVWRTVLTTTGVADPGEDMAQVAEYFPTAADVAAGSISITDIASFANGATAYFSPSLGVGIVGAKEQPPLLTDMVVFNGHVFGVVGAYAQSLDLTLLAVGGQDGLNTGAGIRFTDGSTTEEYVCDSGMEDPANKIFDLTTTGTAAQNIERTARSLVRVINAGSSFLFATYTSGTDALPGRILVYARDNGGDPISAMAIGTGDAWAPRLPSFMEADIERIGGTVFVMTDPPHGLQVDEVVNLTIGDANFPTGNKTVSAVTSPNEFQYVEAGPDASLPNATFVTNTPQVEFDQPAAGNDYAFSDLEEPDAWPPRFRFKVGNLNTDLYRIIAQGNALLFFTSDGLFRMTGRTADEFVLLPVDPTLVLTASKTAVSMGNQAFALTNKGVVSITDLGVEKISEPIDQMLLQYYGGESMEAANAEAFGVAYETENEYTLFLPNPNGDPGDPPDRAYTYNTQTGVWVGPWEFEWEGINDGTKWVQAAHVHKADGRLYISSGDRLTRERKTRTLLDYQDADDVGIPMDVATVVNTAQNPGAYKQWVEATVLFEKPEPTQVEVYFTTELDDVEEGTEITTGGFAAARTYIPLNKSRGARLTVGARYQASQQKMTILGIQTVSNTASTRIGR